MRPTNDTPKGAKRPPAIGEPVNPGTFLCGLVPLGVLSNPKLSHGAKLLYGRLALYAGKNGECFPWNKTLAEDLGGVSDDCISRWLGELRKAGLMTTRFNGPGRPPDHTLRMHPSLLESVKKVQDSAEMRTQADQGPLTPQNCGDHSAEMRRQASANLRLPYKEEIIQKEIIHQSSSSSAEAGSGEPKPIEPTTTKPVSVSEPEPIDREHVRETLRRLRYWRDAAAKGIPVTSWDLPDAAVTNQIIGGEFFEGKADFDNWALFFDSKGVKFKNPGYGLLLKDAEQWPENRASYTPPQRTEPEAAAPTVELPPLAPPILPTPAASVMPEEPQRPRAISAPAPDCPTCRDKGYCFIPGGSIEPIAWCDCDAGEKLRAVKPGFVEEHNRTLDKYSKPRSPELSAPKPCSRSRSGGLKPAGALLARALPDLARSAVVAA